MARYFKRRRAPGENKNEAKVQRRENEGRPGNCLGDLYPNVRQLKIKLRFVTPRQELAGEEDRVITPKDECGLLLSCPGSCGVGTFNLGAKLTSIIEAGEAASDSSAKCQAERYGSVGEPCGYELQCHVDVEYAPEPAKPAP
jgi:hypothetical protein